MAVIPPIIVVDCGFSPKIIQLMSTAEKGTRNMNELDLCEPRRVEAAKYMVVAKVVAKRDKYTKLNQNVNEKWRGTLNSDGFTKIKSSSAAIP